MRNHEVVNAWLAQVSNYDSNPRGSLFYSKETIYSYGSHFPIARLVRAANGEQVALCTTRRYSQTTACHVGLVRNGLYGSAYRIFHVPYPVLPVPRGHGENHDYLVGELYRLLDAARGARTSDSILVGLELARNYAREANEYARCFNLDEPVLSASPPDISEILERAERLNHRI